MINRKSASILILLAFSISMACADTDITRYHEFNASNISSLRINSNAGTVRVERSDSANIEVELTISQNDKRKWFRRTPDISGMDLKSLDRGDQLRLGFNERNVKSDWLVKVPDLSQLDIDLGIGTIDVIMADYGIYVDVGVGSVSLQAAVASTGVVDLSSGVGETVIRGGQSRESRRAMVSSETSALGDGMHTIRARAGVGRIEVELL